MTITEQLELERTVDKLQGTLKGLRTIITKLRCRCAFDYCERCTMLALIDHVVDEDEKINYEESKTNE